MLPVSLSAWTPKADGERLPLFSIHGDRPDHFGTFSEHGSESVETMSNQSMEMHRNQLTSAEIMRGDGLVGGGGGDPNSSFEEMKHTLLERWFPAGGFGSAVVGILTSAVTPSVLSLPLAVSAAGIPFAAAMMTACVVMTLISVRYIAMAAVCSSESDYSFVVAYFLGTKARSVVLNILLFYNFGCGVVNLRFILENFYSLFVHYGMKTEAGPLSFIGLCGVCVCLLPLMFRSRISSLKTVGFFSNFAVLMIAAVVVYEYFIRETRLVEEEEAMTMMTASQSSSLASIEVPPTPYVRPAPTLTTFVFIAPIYIFSYEIQSNVLSVIEDLRSPSPRQIGLIVTAAMVMATFLYMIIGAFGALTFGDDTQVEGNVLKSYRTQDSPLLLSQVMCMFASAVTFLFTMFPARYAIHSAIWSRGRIPAARRAHISLFLCVAGCLTALLVPDVAIAVSWLGALCSSTLSMTIPALLAFKMRSSSGVCQSWYEVPIAALLLICGLGTAIVGTTIPLWAPDV